ncbi:Uu.00g116890.m01.CDS01 [Anthostomella pinea]|uniref:Uu.00g116890.m01.CDS01 n=1 Tax=Anthostomella pinea TaxID=933095 RepID=A0AAI8VG53_9PEZI|nr:Uu.00g116890.m01.CDS01 [Anthostomella pinea]
MPVPFGVSVGDFIGGIEFICSIKDAVEASAGSRAQYHGVLATIQSSQETLTHLNELDVTPRAEEPRKCHRRRYRHSIVTLASKIQKYDKGLSKSRADDWWRALPRKIQWQRSSREHVLWFQSELQQHATSLQLVLAQTPQATAIAQYTKTSESLQALKDQVDQQVSSAIKRRLDQQDASAADASIALHRRMIRNEDAQATFASTVERRFDEQEVIQSRTATDVSTNGQRLARVSTAVGFILVCLFHVGRVVGQLARSIPQRVMLTAGAVSFEDAHAHVFPIYTDFVQTWDAFLYVLTDNFKDKPGLLRVQRRLFELKDRYSETGIALSQPYKSIFRPERHIQMRILFEYAEVPLETCPKCGTAEKGDAKVGVECSNCGLWYTRRQTVTLPLLPLNADMVQSSGVGAHAGNGTHSRIKLLSSIDFVADKPADFARISINGKPSRPLAPSPSVEEDGEKDSESDDADNLESDELGRNEEDEEYDENRGDGSKRFDQSGGSNRSRVPASNLSPALASIPMSIPHIRHLAEEDAPPPLPPPRYVPPY